MTSKRRHFYRRVGRTTLFHCLQRWLHAATLPPEQYERLVERRSRRKLLQTAGALATGALTAHLGHRWSQAASSPRIVIVGAGMGGLSTAYHLRRWGWRALVYEGSNRVGGRIFSTPGQFAPGLVTELGGEFIDSSHDDMLFFARQFGLDLIDLASPSEKSLQTRYVFDGRSYTEAQIIEALRPFARRIAQDAQKVGDTVTYRQHTPHARTLDWLSLADYLRQLGISGWLYDLLTVAYVTEYGLDADAQSSLNLVLMLDTDLRDGFDLYGESDERYKIRGGNQQIPDRLARLLASQLHLEHRLVALRETGSGYRLTFARPGDRYVDVTADVVVLTLPFTLLREVDLQVALPQAKQRAIRELGYGTNAKVILGFQRPFWRTAGFSGDFFTSAPCQSGWDSSRLQRQSVGSLTLFLGGTPGVQVGQGTPQAQARAFLPEVERLFPGATQQYTGKATRFYWPGHAWARGSYACWKVGQYTTLAGSEFAPVGRLFFAGEHTSLDYQGYMNGAAETGRRVAQLLHRQLRS
ncbi:MAG: NAD(P)/FAD-dependent oxidoreductase [Gloeomargarita sp. GMQP_bins_120]